MENQAGSSPAGIATRDTTIDRAVMGGFGDSGIDKRVAASAVTICGIEVRGRPDW